MIFFLILCLYEFFLGTYMSITNFIEIIKKFMLRKNKNIVYFNTVCKKFLKDHWVSKKIFKNYPNLLHEQILTLLLSIYGVG